MENGKQGLRTILHRTEYYQTAGRLRKIPLRAFFPCAGNEPPLFVLCLQRFQGAERLPDIIDPPEEEDVLMESSNETAGSFVLDTFAMHSVVYLLCTI
jgi:hypothetical protein